MTTEAEQTTVVVADDLQTMLAKVSIIMEGTDIIKLALGKEWYKTQTMGELMAGNDRERIGTESMSVSHIVEALRFARANPEDFQAFVEKNRTLATQCNYVHPRVLTDSNPSDAPTYYKPGVCPLGGLPELVDQRRLCYALTNECLDCHGL